jgi:hypothetical protein
MDELNREVVFRIGTSEAISPWHDIPAVVGSTGRVNVVVTTPRKGSQRVEVDVYGRANPVRVLRAHGGAVREFNGRAPASLGFVPQTYAPCTWSVPRAAFAEAESLALSSMVASEAELLRSELAGAVEGGFGSWLLGSEGTALGFLEVSPLAPPARFSVSGMRPAGCMAFRKSDGRTVAWRLVGARVVEERAEHVPAFAEEVALEGVMGEAARTSVASGGRAYVNPASLAWLHAADDGGAREGGGAGDMENVDLDRLREDGSLGARLVAERVRLVQRWLQASEALPSAGPAALEGAVGEGFGEADGLGGEWTPLAGGAVFGAGVARAVLAAHHVAWRESVLAELRRRSVATAQLEVEEGDDWEVGYAALHAASEPRPWVPDVGGGWEPPVEGDVEPPFRPLREAQPALWAQAEATPALPAAQNARFVAALRHWVKENRRREERPELPHH